MRRRRGLVVASVGLLSIVVLSCRGATQISVHLRTDIPCSDLRSTTFTVGRLGEIETKLVTTSSSACEPSGDLGTLIIVPSDDPNDEVAFRVIGGVAREPDTCDAPAYGPGCVVSRRSIRFIPSSTLSLEVWLRSACNGIPCGPTETCIQGQCQDAEISDPSACQSVCGEPSVTASPSPSPPAGTLDGGPPPSPCGSLLGLQALAPWPMSGGCPAHAGRSIALGPRTVHVKWSAPLPIQQLHSSPAVGSDGSVYFTAANGRAYRLRSDGSVQWEGNFSDNSSQSTPAIGADGTIYFGAANAALYAIGTDGKRKWSVAGAGSRFSPAIGPTGVIYAPAAPAAELVAVNADGTVRWRDNGDGGPNGAPAVGSDGTIYYGTSGGLVADNPDGTRRWTLPAAKLGFGGSPAIGADGTIYAPVGTGLLAVTPTGTVAWTYVIAGGASSMPAIAGDGTIVVGGADGQLHAVTSTGTPKWMAAAKTKGAAPAIDAAGNVFAVADTRAVRAFTANGVPLWQYDAPPTTGPYAGYTDVGSIAMGGDGTIYFAADALYAISP